MKKIKSIAKITLYIIVVIHLMLLFFSISSIFTTLLVYILSGLLVVKIIQKTNLIEHKKNNIITFIYSLFICLFLCEVSLKYIYKTHLNYAEKAGWWFYSSVYTQNKVKIVFGNFFDLSDQLHVRKDFENKTLQWHNNEFSYAHQYNKLGYRSPETNFSNNHTKILMLGDSFTEGVGAPADSSWPFLFAQKMNRSYENIQYLNSGIAGKDPYHYYYDLQHLKNIVHPKYVIILLNDTDIDDIASRGAWERFDKHHQNLEWGFWWEPFYASSFIFRNIYHKITQKSLYDFDDQNSLNLIKEVIQEQIYPKCAKMGAELWVFVIPTYQGYISNIDRWETLNFNENSNIKFYKLHDTLKNYAQQQHLQPTDIYWPNDGHLNSKGYDWLAENIYLKLRASINLSNTSLEDSKIELLR